MFFKQNKINKEINKTKQNYVAVDSKLGRLVSSTPVLATSKICHLTSEPSANFSSALFVLTALEIVRNSYLI